MPKFRKKPVDLEAVQWRTSNLNEVLQLAGDKGKDVTIDGDCLQIKTLEGTMLAGPDDWIIRGVRGELYPCKPAIFAELYEPV